MTRVASPASPLSKTRRLFYGSDKTLEISLHSQDFYIDGTHHVFASEDQRDLLLFVSGTSGTATYDAIQEAAFRGKKKDIQKVLHHLRGALTVAGLGVPVIVTVRNSGLHLASGWHVEQPGLDMEDEHPVMEQINAMRKATMNSIDHIASVPLTRNHAGLAHVELNPRTRALASNNYILFNDMGWQLIHMLRRPPYGSEETVPDIIDIKRKLYELMSYATFWRVGDGLSDDKWRRDYRAECTKLLRDIEELVRKVVQL